MLVLLAAAALAADPIVDPDVTITPPDTVVGVVDVGVPVDVVRTALRDPAWVAKVDGGKTSVAVAGREGDCLVADYVSPSALLSVEYRVRRCPTPGGYEAVMLTSNAFEAYRVAWDLAPSETGGTRITYTIQLTTSLWGVPNSLVTSTTRTSVKRMLGRAAAALAPSP